MQIDSAIWPRMGLYGLFESSAQRWSERSCISLPGGDWSYESVRSEAMRVAGAINNASRRKTERVALVLGRSVTQYLSVLGTLASAHSYVPINPKLPVDRISQQLAASDPDVVIVSSLYGRQLGHLLDGAPTITIDVSDGQNTLNIEKRSAPLDTPMDANPLSTAYVMFTSGTTGNPKSVPISHSNLFAFFAYVLDRYRFQGDRFSQNFDFTFDLSLFDMFAAWGSGGTLCPLSMEERLYPAKTVADRNISVWFSVPSVAVSAVRRNRVIPMSMPSLRWSLFCGEALPESSAAAWLAAAPASRLENLYGPTELTIACSVHRYATNDEQERPAIVPIGRIFSHLRWVIAGAVDGEVGNLTGPGELCVGGPQMFDGYLGMDGDNKPEFFHDAAGEKYYRTGDRVELDAKGNLQFLGRVDHQIKLFGFRVELLEIEAEIGKMESVVECCVVPTVSEDEIATGLVAYLALSAGTFAQVRRELMKSLPAYMIPQRFECLDDLPKTANGKIDRKLLKNLANQLSSNDK